ncbi:MAPEG family protein [Pseudoalteromonas sp. MMG022]|uniref:MAPEG family protein n=1 Tax=Pseudoalteromonas sp. MMG022 TaxID=2909978 RepID=UPI001F254E36|nr:MAPEG family protein [Pseudoalteromonas sp. MMG022]MCF6434103.1 MAPEG family protein [Pseudoalteromonas sp. MMG022]
MWVHYPIMFLILLMCFLWLLTTALRISAFKRKRVSASDIQFVHKNNFEITTTLAGNSYDNQFQQSTLFIVLLCLLHQQHIEGHFWFVVSTFFVVARYWHCFEHIVCRNLLMRTIAFALASSCLFIAWFAYLYVNIMGKV